jgi:hypothetical protein
MLRTVFEVAKQQRLTWSCAVLVAMFLSVFGQAPVLPVIAGCLLAIGIAVLRAWPAVEAQGKR